MKKLPLLMLIYFACLSVNAQTIIEKYYWKNDSNIVGKFTGTSGSVDSLNTGLNIGIAYVIMYQSPGVAINGWDGQAINTGDLIYGVYDPNQFQNYALKIVVTAITKNKNVLEDVVYSKSESNARYATTGQGLLASTALQPGSGLSPANISQTASYRFSTDAEKAVWTAKQSSLINQNNIKSINGNSLLGSGDLTINATTISSPTSGMSITSGTAFQPSTTGNITINITTTLSGILGLVGDIQVEWATSSGGTYTSYARESLGLLVAGTVYSSVSITVPQNMWIKVTLTKSATATIGSTYTKVGF